MGNLHGEFAEPGPVYRGLAVAFGPRERTRALPTPRRAPGRPAEVARGALARVVAPAGSLVV